MMDDYEYEMNRLAHEALYGADEEEMEHHRHEWMSDYDDDPEDPDYWPDQDGNPGCGMDDHPGRRGMTISPRPLWRQVPGWFVANFRDGWRTAGYIHMPRWWRWRYAIRHAIRLTCSDWRTGGPLPF